MFVCCSQARNPWRLRGFLLRCPLAQGHVGRAIDLAHERRNGHREGLADDARQPFVVLVLERRLAGLDQLEVGGHELGHPPACEVSTHQRVEAIQERLFWGGLRSAKQRLDHAFRRRG
jgi:hypothetical protein